MVVGEFTQEANVVVIGGGPAGYAAAFRAAELGIDTTIIDTRDDLGGVCLHEGCVPSKTLCDLAATIRAANGANAIGVSFGSPSVDATKIDAWVRATIEKLSKGLAARAKQLKISRIVGEARFEDSKHVAITGGSVPRVKFRKAIIATGSRPVERLDLPFDDERVLTPEQAARLVFFGRQEKPDPRIPKTLLVIGSDYIAVEIASICAALGSKVTLASADSSLLPEVDDDLMRPLRKSLETSLAEIVLAASIDAKAAGRFDRVVISLGRRANVESLDPVKAGVECEADGSIRVDSSMKSSNPRVFAAGDVTGGPMLANLALAQGRVAAEVIAGLPGVFDARAIPHAVFTDPNLAWVGVTEQQARSRSIPHDVAKAPWGLSGRAVGMNRADGLTKIIFEPSSNEVLGVGIVGAGACEMIGVAALAIEMGATLDDLALTLHPHPTMSELIADAARSSSQ